MMLIIVDRDKTLTIVKNITVLTFKALHLRIMRKVIFSRNWIH